MPAKRKAAKKDEVEEKKKSKIEDASPESGGTESKGAAGAESDTPSRGDVHIISSKACQAFAKRHTELEESCREILKFS